MSLIGLFWVKSWVQIFIRFRFFATEKACVFLTSRMGPFKVYVRGSSIRYFLLPDMLRHAPIFRKPGTGSGIGAGGVGAKGKGKGLAARALAAKGGKGVGSEVLHGITDFLCGERLGS